MKSKSRKLSSAMTLGDFRSGMGKRFILSRTMKKGGENEINKLFIISR